MSDDLIRRQDAIDAIHSDIKELDSFDVDYGIKKASIRRAEWRISQVQQVDAVEVVHGEWIKYPIADGMNQCSKCGVLRFGESNYCPNCGAKMDGEEQNDEHDRIGRC